MLCYGITPSSNPAATHTIGCLWPLVYHICREFTKVIHTRITKEDQCKTVQAIFPVKRSCTLQGITISR